MAPLLRTLAYRHRWIYDSVTALASLAVGGPARLRQLGAEALAGRVAPGAAVLDLCCGGGDAARPLLDRGWTVTGLDASPAALAEAGARCPSLVAVEGLAEAPPLPDQAFAAIQISLALHEFTAAERGSVLAACRRMLQPGGWLVVVDLHPAPPLLRLPQRLFCALFETDTARAFLRADLPQELRERGFEPRPPELLAGGALQRLLARRPPASATVGL
jgi:demethylmenaquinone methyltransferase/2-methoxy-6-polyprenyl-1,4-benzoquinol methylase